MTVPGTGDVVLHRPSGERWLVAFCEAGREYGLVACGWPLSFERTADCEVVEAATPDKRAELLERLANMDDQNDPRCRYAKRVLAEAS